MSQDYLNNLINTYINNLPNEDILRKITNEQIDSYKNYVNYFYNDENFLSEVNELQQKIINFPHKRMKSTDIVSQYKNNPDFYKQDIVEELINFNEESDNDLFKLYYHIKDLLVGENSGYNTVIEKYLLTVNRRISGEEGENKLIERLKLGLGASKQKILTNVNINNSEHDVIIISKKGIFTIEIKNHKSHMKWTVNGKFYEGRYNGPNNQMEYELVNPLSDPYHQSVIHRNTLHDILENIGDYTIQNHVVLCNWLEEPTSDDKAILNRVKLLDGFVEEYYNYPDTLTDDEIDAIYNFIIKNQTDAKTFQIEDIAGINMLMKDFIVSHNLQYEKIMSPDHLQLSNIIQKNYANNQIALYENIINYNLNHSNNASKLLSASKLDLKYRFGSWKLVFFAIEGLAVGYYFDHLFIGLVVSLLIWLLIVKFINNGRNYVRSYMGFSTLENYNSASSETKTNILLRKLDLLDTNEKKEEAEISNIVNNFVSQYSDINNIFEKIIN